VKRTVTDIVRRGFDQTVANWPLIMFRIAESILFFAIVIGCVVAIVVPFLVSLGLAGLDFTKGDAPEQVMQKLMAGGAVLILYAIGLTTVLLFFLVLIHSFVQAGITRVFVDSERAAGPLPVPRERLRLFDADRWIAGGRAFWWRVFLIYNIAWTVAGAIMLVPMVVLLAVILLFKETPAVIALGCFALVITLFVVFVIAVLTGIWTQKAIVLAVQRNATAMESLGDAWRDARSDFGRHFAVTFVMLVLAIGGTGVISSFSMMFSIPGHQGMSLMFSPVRIFLSLVSSAFSAAVANWFLASFVALSEDTR
jgi:hypothetical protein